MKPYFANEQYGSEPPATPVPRVLETVQSSSPKRRAEIRRISMIELELAFFGHALKGFARIFDPVLVIVAVRR